MEKEFIKKGSVKKENKFEVFFRSQMYFLKIIYKEHPKSILLFLLITLISSCTPPLLVLINKELIDTISKIGSDGIYLKTVIMLLILYFLIQYLSSFLTNILEYIFIRISQTVNYVIKRLMTLTLIDVPMEEYEKSTFFDTINLANVAIRGNGINIVKNMIGIIGCIISLIGIMGLLTSIHWSLPIALFLSTLPGVVILFISKSRSYRVSLDTSPLERELGFTESLFVDRSSIKEIKIFGIGTYLIEKWSALFKEIQVQRLDLALWELKTKSLATFILQSSSFGVSLFLIYQIFSKELSIGSYVALLAAVTAVQGLFGTAGGYLGSIFEMAIYNDALLKILNLNQKNRLINSSPHSVDNMEGISIDNISFHYPNSNKSSIKDVSLEINRGEHISIVGYNGSGKTTLAKCILGLYEVNQGSIKINGVNVTQINKEDYYKNISVIFQDFTKYKFSLRENVGFGNLSSMDDEDRIFELLRKVELYDKVQSFENFLDTYLTKEIPNGSELSGGEWQRIAIARAFIKDAELVILDEPTSALDPITELKIFKLFRKLSADKTTITISHRIGPTKYADRIIVMEEGELIEEGTFEELMEHKGRYYEMYLSQSEWYKEERALILQ